MFDLRDLGWNRDWEEKWGSEQQGKSAEGGENRGGRAGKKGPNQKASPPLPGRITEEQKNLFRVRTEKGELWAEVAGNMRHRAEGRSDLPAVGDWVRLRIPAGAGRGRIEGILPRHTKLSRKAAGRGTQEQVIAANLDTIFHVTALDRDFNPRRIERYVAMIWSSGAAPVVLLNKADAAGEEAAAAGVADAVAAAPGVEVFAVSAVEGTSLEELTKYLQRGKTVALLGSSGVGKSTLVNRLLGREVQAVRKISSKSHRGRHTTTARHLIVLPLGGILIDTPGMRELEPWDADEGLERTFGDFEDFFEDCQFSDCAHRNEPGCAVLKALAEGRLDADRWESYLRLRRELRFQATKHDAAARAAQNRRWRKICKEQRDIYKQR